jgi:hypothetical protein
VVDGVTLFFCCTVRRVCRHVVEVDRVEEQRSGTRGGGMSLKWMGRRSGTRGGVLGEEGGVERSPLRKCGVVEVGEVEEREVGD